MELALQDEVGYEDECDCVECRGALKTYVVSLAETVDDDYAFIQESFEARSIPKLMEVIDDFLFEMGYNMDEVKIIGIKPMTQWC